MNKLNIWEIRGKRGDGRRLPFTYHCVFSANGLSLWRKPQHY